MEVKSAPQTAERRIWLSFLLFCGLMEGKYALMCAMDILKIQMVVQDLLYLRNQCECIAGLNPSASCRPRTRCLLIYQQTSANQNTAHLKTGFI